MCFSIPFSAKPCAQKFLAPKPEIHTRRVLGEYSAIYSGSLVCRRHDNNSTSRSPGFQPSLVISTSRCRPKSQCRPWYRARPV